MDVSFDIRGNLKPYEKIELTLAEFKEIFVDSFEEDSSRHQIFEQYQKFLKDFSEQVTDDFEQWINGSFVSSKRNPKDIDFVTIIDYSIFEQKEALIEQQFRLVGAQKMYQLDAYTVRRYPVEHKHYSIYKGELAYWEHWFGQTKKNRAKIKFNKGFIRILFQGSQKLEL